MKKGFTLAEILITLGIIGVIAILTLPILVQNYQKHILIKQYKVFYRDITNAIELFLQDNNVDDFGETPLGDLTIPFEERKIYFIENFLEKYIVGSSGEFPKIPIRNLTKTDSIYFTPQFITEKSVALEFSQGMWNSIFTITFDINGKKGPNIIGRDVFRFYIYLNSRIPQGAYMSTKDWDCQNCGDCCRPDLNPHATGWGCWQRIIQDGWEMNY